MNPTQPLEVNDFSGGITDNFIDGPLNKAEKMDNLVLDKNGKLLLRHGSEVLSSTTYQIPIGSERVNALIDMDGTLIHTGLTELSYTGASSNSNLRGPSSNTCFDVGAETNKVSWAIWNKHLLVTNDGFPKISKVYKDDSSTWRLRTAGLPALATSPTVTAGGAGANTYIYAFVYSYTYNVGTVEFEDISAVTQVTVGSAAAPNSNAISITNIPVLANGSTLNYDTSVIKVKIYRTITNGSTFFYVGQVTNGTTSYSDSAADTTIDDNATIYTTGGVVENDEPPKAKYLHVVNDICWYGHVKEGTEVQTNKIRQSVKFDPDSCPETFYDELEDEITGLSSIQGTLIAFCKGSIYRVEGFFDELGRGGITHQRISDSVGCVSNNSIVRAMGLIFFAGTDGFYYTDGYNVKKLTLDLNDSYKELIEETQQKLNIYGEHHRLENTIWWGVEKDTSSNDNDSCYVLDLNYGLESGTFTTFSGSDSFRPTALCFFNNQMVRGDTRGYLFKHDLNYYTDPKINESATPDNWTTQAIIYDYRSIYTSFGTTSIRKWVPSIVVDLFNKTNVSVQIISDNDRGRLVENLKQLRYRGNFLWGDPTFVWGTSTCVWGRTGIIEEKKFFPSQSLRCNYKQVRFTNAYTIVQNSDQYGLATVSGTDNTATLVGAATYDWDAGAVDYYISFANDSYAREYLITARTADTVTFQDIDNVAPTGNYAWLVKGYKKGEVFHLLSYVLYYALLSRSQKPYFASEGGENA